MRPQPPASPTASGQGALQQAAADLRFLLERGYPRQNSLALVGDRHGLDARARHLLRRGVYSPQAAQVRRARLLGLGQTAGRAVAVDGHNVLITLENALAGRDLVLCDDGVIRDIAGAGANHRPGELTLRAAAMLFKALARAAEVLVLLDAPISQSGELAASLRGMMAEAGLAGQARAVPVPERELTSHPGPVASSDSQLLDLVTEPLDLAGTIIMTMNPAPTLVRLG